MTHLRGVHHERLVEMGFIVWTKGELKGLLTDAHKQALLDHGLTVFFFISIEDSGLTIVVDEAADIWAKAGYVNLVSLGLTELFIEDDGIVRKSSCH